jgi:hypothetical protein
MKNYKGISEKYSPEEIAESFVFPGSTNKTHMQAQLEGFRAFRRNEVSKLTDKDKLINLLLQLRFQIEDYLQDNSSDRVRNFASS